jgi:hypothetical protein
MPCSTATSLIIILVRPSQYSTGFLTKKNSLVFETEKQGLGFAGPYIFFPKENKEEGYTTSSVSPDFAQHPFRCPVSSSVLLHCQSNIGLQQHT